jgi:hypothetical protein
MFSVNEGERNKRIAREKGREDSQTKRQPPNRRIAADKLMESSYIRAHGSRIADT